MTYCNPNVTGPCSRITPVCQQITGYAGRLRSKSLLATTPAICDVSVVDSGRRKLYLYCKQWVLLTSLSMKFSCNSTTILSTYNKLISSSSWSILLIKMFLCYILALDRLKTTYLITMLWVTLSKYLFRQPSPNQTYWNQLYLMPIQHKQINTKETVTQTHKIHSKK